MLKESNFTLNKLKGSPEWILSTSTKVYGMEFIWIFRVFCLYLYLEAQNKSSMVKIHQEQLMPKERNNKYQEASHKRSLNIYYTNSGILGKSY